MKLERSVVHVRRGDTRYTGRCWANCHWDEMILQMLTGEGAPNHDRHKISPVAGVRRPEAGIVFRYAQMYANSYSCIQKYIQY